MSFGFGASDFFLVLHLTTSIITACKNGPKEYHEACSEVRAMQMIVERLRDDADDPYSILNSRGSPRKQELLDIIQNCGNVLAQLQALINKHSRLELNRPGSIERIWHAHRVATADLGLFAQRMSFYVGCISLFLQSLEGSVMMRMAQKIDELHAKLLPLEGDQTMDERRSVVSVAESVRSRLDTDEEGAWQDIKKDLLSEDISAATLAMYRAEIIELLKRRIDEEQQCTASEEHTNDAGTIDEEQSDEEEAELDGEPLFATALMGEYDASMSVRIVPPRNRIKNAQTSEERSMLQGQAHELGTTRTIPVSSVVLTSMETSLNAYSTS